MHINTTGTSFEINVHGILIIINFKCIVHVQLLNQFLENVDTYRDKENTINGVNANEIVC